jgi:hypothetical protein
MIFNGQRELLDTAESNHILTLLHITTDVMKSMRTFMAIN